MLYSKIQYAVLMTSTLRFAKLADLAVSDHREAEKIKKLADAIYKPNPDEDAERNNAKQHRIFVSETVWAHYTAYASVHAFYIAQWTVLKTGVSKDALNSPENIFGLIRSVLPDANAFIAPDGFRSVDKLLEKLEQGLMKALREDVEGNQQNQEIEQAASVLASVANLEANMTKITHPEISQAIAEIEDAERASARRRMVQSRRPTL